MHIQKATLDRSEAISEALGSIARIEAVSAILRVVCQSTGMRFAAVARVTATSWTACAVHDEIDFGIQVGDQLELHTTLCNEVRLTRQPVTFDHASADPVYRLHPTPRLYGIESYVSVPIFRKDSTYFGNLCAVDPKPAQVSNARTVGMLQLFAQLIALQLDGEERARAAESALLDARAASQLREEFIAVLGHDLRNPLSAIAVAAELLVRRPAEPALVKIGQRLKSATGRMSRLIDDVLDFARGRLGGGLGVELANVGDVADALRDVIQESRDAHPGRVIEEKIDVDRAVRCDRGRLQQLASNLLGNALVHGDPGQPVFVDAALEKSGWLVVSVANAGKPIEPENLAKVFEPYWRPAVSKPAGGLGLGLYICSRIVQEHAGVLEVTSSLAEGTRFTAKIPAMAIE